MNKTTAQHFYDWESHVFGFGYGTGENYILPALKDFLTACPSDGCYSHVDLEKELTPLVAWLFINVLCHCDIIEYGTSPRNGWLTKQGRSLKKYCAESMESDFNNLYAATDESYCPCYPDHCNCEEGTVCANPFWIQK
jgi:hypothetical protein